ncbi:MAG TPA: cytochrome D1 domain-containing protein [Bryobacteraceae bacterium]|jgi:DNA-binding beta-propeller fold protein YncE|nr:cytochrome D1 domain-containing protein [Bryobacteraceae bacterium]
MSAFAADTGNNPKSWLLVANKGEHTLGLIDPSSGKQVAAVDEGGVTGHEVIASPDGRTAYVPIYGNSGVGKPGTDGTHLVAIDLATQKVTGQVDFGHGVRPHCPMFGPKNGMLYVSTELEEAISMIDPHSLKIVGKVPTGAKESHMFSITNDGKRAYTANVGPGTVSALDLVNKKTIAVIPVAKQVQRMSISADDKYAFTSDVDAPRLAVIDTASNKVKQWIELPAPGYGSAVSSDNKWLVIAIPAAHKVAAIDLASMKVAHTVDVPASPQETLIRPDQKMAYVSCDASGKVAEIDMATWKVTRLIDAGKGADGLAWSGK